MTSLVFVDSSATRVDVWLRPRRGWRELWRGFLVRRRPGKMPSLIPLSGLSPNISEINQIISRKSRLLSSNFQDGKSKSNSGLGSRVWYRRSCLSNQTAALSNHAAPDWLLLTSPSAPSLTCSANNQSAVPQLSATVRFIVHGAEFVPCQSKAVSFFKPVFPHQPTNILTKRTVPSNKVMSCCRRSGGACVCASEATCSCGKKSAGECNCEKSATENYVSGATCSCGTFSVCGVACFNYLQERDSPGNVHALVHRMRTTSLAKPALVESERRVSTR
jgi:hypothetical protein